jgi:DNA-directed RNA polymerase specialized sigma24 family protein
MEHAHSAEGAEAIFESVYAEHFEKLARYAILKGLPDPEGYAQDVLIQFWKKYDSTRKIPPAPFLWRLARDMAVDAWRRVERRPEMELIEDLQPDRATAPDSSAATVELLDRLPSHCSRPEDHEGRDS